MKPILISVFILLSTQLFAQPMETIEKITWYGQASIQLDCNDQKIFIDPYHLNTEDKADIILITHSHGDHLSIDDINKIATSGTKFVCPADCEENLLEAGYDQVSVLYPGDNIRLNGIEILAVPMYNVVKTNYHPKENNWNGYIVNVDGILVYHAGDTERIPEMKDLQCDIALLPLGQTYTMNSVEEAAEAVLDINPSIAIPIHYGMYEGSEEDALKFKELLNGKVEVVILEPVK